LILYFSSVIISFDFITDNEKKFAQLAGFLCVGNMRREKTSQLLQILC